MRGIKSGFKVAQLINQQKEIVSVLIHEAREMQKDEREEVRRCGYRCELMAEQYLRKTEKIESALK